MRRVIPMLLFVALLLAAAQSFVDLRIRSIRESSPVSISQLERRDPVRRLFGALHGASMGLLLLQAFAAAIVVMFPERPAAPSAHREHVPVDVELVDRKPEDA
jgi:hypothetical protein